MSINIPTICLTSIGPLITLSVAGLLLLLIDAFSIKGAKKGYFHQFSLVAIIGIIQTVSCGIAKAILGMVYGQLYLLLLYDIFDWHRHQHNPVSEIFKYIRKIMGILSLMLFSAVGMIWRPAAT
jgi:uncharacterized membrane protein YdcZ (DUF606 family)